MKAYFLTFFIAIAALRSSAQEDSIMFRRISDEIMLHGTCYENLRVLCKNVGHRLAGSPASARAVIWGEQAMKDAGADKVWLQAANVDYWYRGKESLKLKFGKGKYHEVPALSLGNSQGTDGKLLKADIVMVHNFDEFKALPENKIKGKIIFFNYRFRQDYINTFEAYGDAVKYRWASPSVAAARGAVGVIIRSMSTGKDDFPHTGVMRYVDSIKKIPEMALGNVTADALENAINDGQLVSVKWRSECHMVTPSVRSYNVIGEIKGSEHPEKIITVGGHLDSWDVGEGANDDGSGCVQAIEIIRAMKAIGIRPKCTIRAVLFMNEENGDRGGHAYADSAKSKSEQHILAIESDAGGFSPRGLGLVMTDVQKAQIRAFKELFLPYGVYNFSMEEGGTDIEPLKDALKTPLVGLIPDSQRYFDIHHTNNDVFENVNHRELKLGAVAMAQLIYLVDSHNLLQ